MHDSIHEQATTVVVAIFVAREVEDIATILVMKGLELGVGSKVDTNDGLRDASGTVTCGRNFR